MVNEVMGNITCVSSDSKAFQCVNIFSCGSFDYSFCALNDNYAALHCEDIKIFEIFTDCEFLQRSVLLHKLRGG